MNTSLKKSLRDIAIYFPGKILPALASFITIPIYARLFRPEDYGSLALIGTFTAAGGIALGTWLTSSTMRFLPQYRREKQSGTFYFTLLCAYFLSVTIFSILAIPVYFTLKDTVGTNVYRLLPLAGVLTLLSTVFLIIQTIYRADQNPKPFVLSEVLNVYGSVTVGLFLILYFGLGIEGVLWGSFLATSIVSFGGVVSLLGKHKSEGGGLSFSGTMLREFAVYGLPGGVATMGAWVLALSDRYIIEIFRGSAEVGLYSMGYGIADKSIKLVVSSLILAIGPSLINLWESEHREYTTELLKQMTRFTLLVLVPLVVMFFVLNFSIFQVLTTNEYLPGAAVLPWIALGAAFYGLKDLAYTGLVLAKKSIIIARNTLIAAAINVILNLTFVPYFGFMAAAVNTTISYAILLAMNTLSSRQYLPWMFPWNTLRNTLIAAGIMYVFLWILQAKVEINIMTLLISGAGGALVYGCSLLVVGEFSSRERRMLSSFIGFR